MNRITPIDVSRYLFDIHRDLSVTTRAHRPGPPIRIDGMTVGIITITDDAPHRGEVHPDGDEILYVVSGSLQVTGESEPTPTSTPRSSIVRNGFIAIARSAPSPCSYRPPG